LLVGFACVQCYGRQQCRTRLDQTVSDRWPTRRETEGALFRLLGGFLLWDQFAKEAECKENDETQRDERSIIVCKKKR
jgi:hypothetical protein